VSRISGDGGSRKRKRPAAEARDQQQQRQQQHVPAIFRSLPKGRASAITDGTEIGNGKGSSVSCDAFGDAVLPDEDLLPCDTLLALRSMVSKNSAAVCPLVNNNSSNNNQLSGYHNATAAPNGLPFVLKPMLHHALLSTVSSSTSGGSDYTASIGNTTSSTNDDNVIQETNRTLSAGAATGVNVELEELRQSNVVRLIQLHGTGDAESDLAVMETAAYEHGVRDAFAASSKDRKGCVGLHPYSIDLCTWFISFLPRWTGKFVRHEAIRLALLDDDDTSTAASGLRLPAPCRDLSKLIHHLIGIGLLLPRNAGSTSVRQSDTSYWFTLPCMGVAAKSIADGRKRVLVKLKRSNYGEVRRAALEVGTLPSSKRAGASQSLVRSDGAGGGGSGGSGGGIGMPAAFHIRDLLSRGEVRIRDTPAGQFIRIASASSSK